MAKKKKAASAAPKRGRAAAAQKPKAPAPAKKTRGTKARQASLPNVSADGDDAALNEAIAEAYAATEEWQTAGKKMRELRAKVQELLKAKKLPVYVSDEQLEARLVQSAEKITIKKTKDGAGTIPDAPSDSGDDDEWEDE